MGSPSNLEKGKNEPPFAKKPKQRQKTKHNFIVNLSLGGRISHRIDSTMAQPRKPTRFPQEGKTENSNREHRGPNHKKREKLALKREKRDENHHEEEEKEEEELLMIFWGVMKMNER